MIESLRRVSVGVMSASLLAFGGTFYADMFSCPTTMCGAATFLSQAPVQNYAQPTVMLAGGLMWGVAMYGFWISALGLFLLEFLKPRFFKKHIKRLKR